MTSPALPLDPSRTFPPSAAALQGRGSALARWVRVLAYGGIVVNLVLLMRVLPVDRLVDLLSAKVDALGPWGALVFGTVYVVAALLFVPGSALTLAAGAIFGLVGGTVTVSLASTTAAALAFLIGRHVARDAVVEKAKTSPRFAAMDQAIREGGWKIVALLRLSPAVPFSLGNYLFGLTPIRFVPYVLTSWLFMLPGTLMYVYVGHAGRAGIAAAAGSGEGRSPGEWALLVVGLLATVAVTVYVTRLARRGLRSQTTLEAGGNSPSTPDVAQDPDAPRRRWLGVLIPVAAALLLLGVNVFAHGHQDRLAYLFGPPAVVLSEKFAAKADGTTFDHAPFDALLRAHVDEAGLVDYEGLARDGGNLDRYIESLAKAKLDELGRDERLAFLLNAYNAFTLRLILDHRPLASIRDIPAEERWDARRWNVGGRTVSLNGIEHEEIRPNFKEPRIHFALVCAAIGCPPLRREAYEGRRLEAQLAAQARYVHTHERWFRYDPTAGGAGAGTVGLTQLYDWYGGDFEQVAGSVLDYAALQVPALRRALDAGKKPTVGFLDYDWALNAQEEGR